MRLKNLHLAGNSKIQKFWNFSKLISESNSPWSKTLNSIKVSSALLKFHSKIEISKKQVASGRTCKIDVSNLLTCNKVILDLPTAVNLLEAENF